MILQNSKIFFDVIGTKKESLKTNSPKVEPANLDITTEPAKRCYIAKGARMDNTTTWQSIHPTNQGGKASARSDNQSDTTATEPAGLLFVSGSTTNPIA